MKRLSDTERDKIILAFENGLVNQVEIAKALGISQMVVSTTLMKHRHSKCPSCLVRWNFCPECGINLRNKYWR
jgi:hypothetical protein